MQARTQLSARRLASLAQRLRGRLAIKRGVTLTALAEWCGVSVTTAHNWLAGNTRPTPEGVRSMRDYLAKNKLK